MSNRTLGHTTQFALCTLFSFSLIAASCGGGNVDSTDESDVETETTEAEIIETEAEATSADSVVVDQEVDTDDVVETETGPVFGGTLRYGIEADVDGLNPTSSALSAPGLVMANAVFDALGVFTPDGVVVPYLAESFTPNDDFTQWQVKLRDGISFHDGTPLNAEAVQINFETQRADPLIGNAVRPFYPEDGATEVLDDLTIQFNLLDSNAVFPNALASQRGLVASPAWIAAALEDPTLSQEPVGTGPFVFDSRSQDSITRFVRNESWWNGDVYLDAIEFFPVPDPSTRNDLFFTGDLDALHTADPGSVGDLIGENSIQNVIDENGEESFLMLNSEVAPFDDVRARKALALATPLENYRALIGLGVARGADQMFVPESPYYNPDVIQEGDDPEGAIALVGEYCAERGDEINTTLGDGVTTCTDGKINFEFQWPGPSVTATRIADLLDEGWSNAGFNVTFNELAADENTIQTAVGQYNVVAWRQFGASDAAADNVWLMCRSIGGISLNWARYCDESRDALLLEAQATNDPAVRIPLYQELSQKLHDDYLYVFTLHTKWDNAFGPDVRGVCDRVTPEGIATLCAAEGQSWLSSVWIEA